MPLRIPRRWDEVTPTWMTAALAERCPGAVVDTVTFTGGDEGSNRRGRFRLTYSAGGGPEAVFLKAHNKTHRLVHLRNGNLFGEARLFASGIELPLEHPAVYTSVVDRRHLDFLIVMEDLAGRSADPRDATRPLTISETASGLRALAALHSAYWDFSRKTRPELVWVKDWRPTRGWLAGLRKRLPAGLERANDLLPEAVRRLGAKGLLDLWAQYVRGLTSGSVTLLHGDTHIGNTYVLPGGGVGFLDWQVIRRGHWSQDVGHFLIGSLPVPDRRGAERELLEEYRAALTIPAAALPTADEIWASYRASAVYGLVIWLSTLGSAGYQAPEVSRALVSRFADAFSLPETGKVPG